MTLFDQHRIAPQHILGSTAFSRTILGTMIGYDHQIRNKN